MSYTFTRTGAQIEEIHNTVGDPKSNAQFSDDIRTIAGEYRGLWPDTGGSANKGDTYQTQVSGTGTGQYFTALQNTTVDPDGDDVNWREAISEASFSKYTELAYNSVPDMIAGNPTTPAVGDKCSTGGSKWIRVSNSNNDLADFKLLSQYAYTYDWGVKGDAGVTDNADAGQQALDDQRDFSIPKLLWPMGDIHTSKELVDWCNTNEFDKTANPVNHGYGRGLTRIIRTTRTGSNLPSHSGIVSVWITANDFIKAGNTVTVPASEQTKCYYGEVGHLDLVGQSPDATRVGLGHYSLGTVFREFNDVEISGVETTMATEHWNVFCKYRKVEMQLNGNGCDFGRTNFGGNSDLYFEKCHANGINGFCYSILANATFVQCSIDGGGGKHYVIPGFDRGAAGILGGAITLKDCKSESPAIFEGNAMFDLSYGRVDVQNSSLMIPTVNYTSLSRMIDAKNYSKFTTRDARVNLRVGDSPSLGALYSRDGTSQIRFDAETFIDTEWFDTYKKVFYNPTDKKIIANRDKNGVAVSDITKFIYFVSGAIPAGERTTTTTSFSSNRIQIDCTQQNGHTMSNGVMFNQALDLTNYSQIYIQGDVDFIEGDVTGVNYQCYINSSLIADGSVGVGAALPMDYVKTVSGEKPGNFNSTNFNRYVDISDIEGIYYIGLELFGININSNIQEISLIR